MACSNNVPILYYFFDTITFTVYVTAYRGPNLEKYFILGKQLQLKITDTFPLINTHKQKLEIWRNDRDHQVVIVGGPSRRPTNKRWRTAAILKKKTYMSI